MGNQNRKASNSNVVPSKPKQDPIVIPKSFESWGVNDVLTHFRNEFKNASDSKALENYLRVLNELMIDGDGVLSLDKAFLDDLKIRLTSDEDDAFTKIIEEIQLRFESLQEKELKNQYEWVIPQKQPIEEFPPYDLPDDVLKKITHYHDATKNGTESGARSFSHDWHQMTRTWRRYYGAPHFLLPLPRFGTENSKETSRTTFTGKSCKYNKLYEFDSVVGEKVTLNSMSQFLCMSLALSARKPVWQNAVQPRSAWTKRCNASSGGLHPCEGYIITDLLHSGNSDNNNNNDNNVNVYHYSVKDHGLETRGTLNNKDEWRVIFNDLPIGSFLFGITTVNWREIWKYGERAFRYCQLDIGHAFNSVVTAARSLGWFTYYLDLDDITIGSILGIDQIQYKNEIEREFPAIIALITPQPLELNTLNQLSNKIKKNEWSGVWKGIANVISYGGHAKWDIIDDITKATCYTSREENSELSLSQTPVTVKTIEATNELYKSSGEVDAHITLRTRRSALDFSPKEISKEKFLQCIGRILPSTSPLLWSSNGSLGTHIHVGLFIYRVNGIKPGYYVLVRGNESEEIEKLKNATAEQSFEWTKVSDLPIDLPLYKLKEGDAETVAKEAYESSCRQNLILRAAFCCSMFTDLSELIQENTPHNYRRIHWEAGMIGQVLYNESCALSLSATGLGCFVDNLSTELFGLTKSSYRPLYHFTVGYTTMDVRYTPYHFGKDILEFTEEEDELEL